MGNEFDEELRRRLLAFQRAHGLTEDGKAGGETWGKLAEAYGEQRVGQSVAGQDDRTDAEVVRELEQRTRKSYDDLVLGLGQGPIQISPREVERRLYGDGTLRPRLPDNSRQTVLDEVLERHEHMGDRFVSRGVVGSPESVARRKEAGQAEHNAQLQQNLGTLGQGLSGARVPPKSTPPGPKPAKPGPPTFDKVDPSRLGGGKPANDNMRPPPGNVVPLRPPEEQPAMPHGEIVLDTGTGGRVRASAGSRPATARVNPEPPAKVPWLSLGNRRANGAQFMVNADQGQVAASTSGYQVYEFYASDGRCLYVGRSGGRDGETPKNWVDRGWDHLYKKPGIAEASTVKVTADLTEAETAVLETDLISSLKPELNTLRGSPPRDQDYAANLQSANTRPTFVFQVRMVPPR